MKGEDKMEEKQNNTLEMEYPLLCTRGSVLFPKNKTSVEVGRDFSQNAIHLSIEKYEGYIVVIPQLDPNSNTVRKTSIANYGTMAKIDHNNISSTHLTVTLIGLQRVKLLSFHSKENCFFGQVSIVEDFEENMDEEAAYIHHISEKIQQNTKYNDFLNNVARDSLNKLTKGVTASEFTDIVAQYGVHDLKIQIDLLKTSNVLKRLETIAIYLEKEMNIQKIEDDISMKIKKHIDDSQKEFYLREKLRVIKEELGDITPSEKDADEIRKLLDENPYPESIKNKILSELRRFETMPQASGEASMLKTYIDWLIDIPWYQKSEDNTDILKVETILDEDHYGLEKIKERIVEYLAVKTLTSSLKAPILCFVGPPGVGKTSLAKSIARALDRKFVKMSLGGVKDEAEIRGHRRTYIGALPGRVIQSMKKAGVINPVFLLDEIDKMGADYKGDPASAMLELLDPEQNKYFSDHYIEEPYDLSNVLFIATANYLENIPAPLRDRLEIIQISSYTEIEKENIAIKHLVPKQLIAHGLENENISFTEDALMHIIRYYTREAGVRNLERAIAKICRKLVVRKLKNNLVLDIKTITIKMVQEYLGKEIFDYSKKEKVSQIGVVTGLAYTEFGGDILPIEVNYFDGKGALIVTGQLGDVMKESASIAFDYVKANANTYHIDSSMFAKIDLHIHVPEGAVPKDGPSAGITMTTAIVSALTKRAVKSDLAMTGEVTLRGNVLPIGGLKEKSISAHRSGITTVIIPQDNEKDLEELPKIVTDEIKFIPVSHVEQVINLALEESSNVA